MLNKYHNLKTKSIVKKQTLMVMLIVCISTISIAQTLSGVLKNQDGHAIPNVAISLQQTSRTTTSDSTGSFSIKISRKKRKLLFQHPDYKSKLVKSWKRESTPACS